MTAETMEDLERAFPGADALLARLLNAPTAIVPDGFASQVMARVETEAALHRNPVRRPWIRWAVPIAASVAALIAITAIFSCTSGRSEDAVASLVACQRADGFFSNSAAAPYVQAFAVKALSQCGATPALEAAVAGLVRTQNAAGGWDHGVESVRNVAALEAAAAVGAPGALKAYRRGARYLRMNGLAAISGEELVKAARAARTQLIESLACDEGVMRCVALCAR